MDVMVFDSSSLLAVLYEIRRPDLIYLFHNIDSILVIPASVNAEIIRSKARKILDDFIMAGIIIVDGTNVDDDMQDLMRDHPGLGLGEAGVILTCKKMSSRGIAVTGILDDQRGRRVAKKHNVNVTGLLGLLEGLRRQHLLDDLEHDAIIAALRSSQFRLPPP